MTIYLAKSWKMKTFANSFLKCCWVYLNDYGTTTLLQQFITNIAVPLFVLCNIWKHRFTFWFPHRCLMQTGHKHNLVKRMRYYHSAIDVDSLLRGNPYDQLKKSYVIFICNFDLCGDGFPVYESQTVWKQNGREINDGQVKIVYNTSAFEKAQDPRLRALLQYLSMNSLFRKCA